VFPASDSSYGCYRIPATVTLPNGNVLAFAEGRPSGCPDFGNIQIVMLVSTDCGTTWGPMSVVASNGTLEAGNASPVVDTQDPNYPNGRVFLFYNTGNNTETNIRNGNGLREQWYITSTDGGVTWSSPTNITSQTALMGASPYNNPADWRALAMGPGHALQLPDGRIVVAGTYSSGPPQTNYADYNSYAFYTTDHGATFQIGGNTGYPGTNESQVAQLSTGAVMMNSRNQSGLTKSRLVSTSTDEAVTFSYAQPNPTLIDPICEGSILNITWNGKPYLIFSNPASTTSRDHLTMRGSKDDGNSWPFSLLITAYSSAYSDLTQVDANDIGIIYEDGSNGIRFMKVPVSTVVTSP
jgi:sialidase-1